MTKFKRPPIPPAIQRNIRTKNLGVCCVCKERGIGTNFHHIDGYPTNNNEENIALLCVKEHDQHHRPHAYDQTKHLELGADKIREYKREWELVVRECKSENPKVLAVVNAFGDLTNIHSVKFFLQNLDGKIIYERLYHWHYGTADDWTDWIMEEAVWLGKNVKLTVLKKSTIKKQATDIKEKIFATWQPGQIFIGTGNPDKPTLIDKFKLPDIWEKKNNR